MTKAEHRLIWIQVALLIIGTTALLYGAFAHISWVFWGIGLPLEIIAIIYTYILWAQEERAQR